MVNSLFFGGSVIAAVVAGALALFAPCCISFMLPAYFASAFQNRLRLVAMTFLFAAGVATIILPLALGASLLRQLFAAQHALIYLVGGLFLLGLAVFLLLGGQFHLPMPGGRPAGRAGIVTTYTLGLFSGVTSSCCVPVLAGVIAFASVAPSFWIALGLGAAYVFGMIAPLFLISVLWEQVDWKASRLFHPRLITWRLGPVQRRLHATALLSGLLLLVMGTAMIWIGLTERTAPALSGWQASFAVTLQHLGRVITNALAILPNWLAILALVLVIAWLARRAFRQMNATPANKDDPVDGPQHTAEEPGKETTHANI